MQGGAGLQGTGLLRGKEMAFHFHPEELLECLLAVISQLLWKCDRHPVLLPLHPLGTQAETWCRD